MIRIYSGDEIYDFITALQSLRDQVSGAVEQQVAEIIHAVCTQGDSALYDYANKFDHIDLTRIDMLISEDELHEAHQKLSAELLSILRKAEKNITHFHRKSLTQSWLSWEEDDVVLGQRLMPLERVGIYVPGGRAAYPSSLLMAAAPARVAGVNEIIITSPCTPEGVIHPVILATAWELGITKVYRIGGAHAIAAMAYGTQTVPKVDKIVGPGNIYVATAKKMLFGQVGIDMIAGPSEVVIVADDSANPVYVAADLLAQAEHDPMASSILITHFKKIAEQVVKEMKIQLSQLPRKEIIESSIKKFGAILITSGLDQNAELANELAPEHLGLHIRDPWKNINLFKHAGAIFLGHYSPEAVGDYWAGPNHILPTNRTARFFSPLRSEDFCKVSSIISYSETALKKNSHDICHFARTEGLEAHAQAIAMRTRQ